MSNTTTLEEVVPSLNIQEIKDNKDKIKDIKLLLIKKNSDFSDGYEPIKALIHKNIYPKIIDIYMNNNLDVILKDNEFDKLSYDVNDDSVIPYLKFTDLNDNTLFRLLNESINNLDDIDSFTDLNTALSKSYLYAFIFTLENHKTFTIIRKISSSNYLKNKGLLCLTGGRLNFIQENLFSLDSKVDCILYDNLIYIVGKYNFETLFSYRTHYTNEAQKTLSIINQHSIIANFENFSTDCLQRSSMIKKLAELQNSGELTSFISKLNTDPKLVEKTIKKYNLDITLEDKKIVYKDLSSLSEIVNLISENYFESDLSHKLCLAKGKKYIPRVTK